MYQYNAELIRVIDGDTVKLRVDVGFRMAYTDNFRLAGIDTPELNSSDPEERERAQKAKDFLQLELHQRSIRIETTKPGKYGRWLATIEVYTSQAGWVDVNRMLLSKGLAVPY